MKRQLYKLYHPEIFQGDLKKKNYFEGWYYKIVTADESQAIAIIPGVSIGRDNDSHAFVQVLNGKTAQSYYHTYPIERFRADKKVLDVSIADNHFNKKKIELSLPSLSGTIKLNNLTPLSTSITNPGIMGWFSFTPKMQCYHGVVSMGHDLEGTLTTEGKTIDFSGGRGYIEKDWGTSFPKCWIWAHSNHFKSHPELSLMASVAHIPWMGNYFIGFIVALHYEGKTEVYATYNRAKKQVSIDGETVHMTFKRKNRVLNISAVPGAGADLKSPISGLMTGKVNESLAAEIKITLVENGKTLIEDYSTTSGLEVAGDVSILLG